MANTRNKVAIVFDGVVCRGELRSSVFIANFVRILGTPRRDREVINLIHNRKEE
ncbi:MAG: hypothetical protein FWH14_08470 [Oscillospiraceae bacterium]|nr:hypothetical protein [Oscillospiraceae bacterium]